MKAKINIKFEKVSDKAVNRKMSSSKKFIKATDKTVKKLCEQIERYFLDFKIQTKVTYKLG